MAEQGLTSLNVTGAGTLRDGGIAAIATQCRCLRSLNISGADRVTDVAIREYEFPSSPLMVSARELRRGFGRDGHS